MEFQVERGSGGCGWTNGCEICSSLAFPLCVSTLHAVIVGLFCLYILWYDDAINANPIWGDPWLVKLNVAVTCGYLLYDLLLLMRYWKTLGDSLFVCHHLVALYAYGYVLSRGVLPYFANFRLLSELSTPFVNLRWFLDAAGWPRTSRLVLANGLAMTVVFFMLAQKYDPQRELELRQWIEEATGKRIGDNFMESLKDGVILCELINKLQPGSVRKVNESTQNWHQLENIGNFIKAITRYGVKPHDSFEANDLFENTNHTQVQSTLIALASMAKTKGNRVNVGVKYAEKQQRKFLPEKLKEGRNIIGLQMGTNKFASQQGMTAYGTRRHLFDPKLSADQPLDQATISLQMGTNKGASQAGMTAPGTKRQIFEPTLGMEHCDTQNISLQMGSNKGASQQGMTVYGLPRQVYDSKYCLTPTYPVIGDDEDQYNHSHHNFYNTE
ncbi:calponin-1 isoform 2-T7 [Vipera latastei]